MTEHQQQLLPMSAGDSLQQARKKRRLSLETVAGALRVPVDVVEAIEADDLGRFAPVYQRGYLTAYAKFVGMDDARVEGLLDSIEHDTPELHSVFPRAPRRGQADRWLKASSYVLASLLIGTLAWQVTHEAVRLSQGPSRVSAGEVTGTVGATGEQRAAAPATHVNASIAALEKMRQPIPGVGRGAGEAAWSALQQATESPAGPAGLPHGRHLLRLTASADSWVEIVDAQGHQLELDLVRGGSEKEYQGTAPFRILFGRASAVELFMDGEAVNTEPFTSGDVTQMTLAGEPAAGPAPDGDAD